MRQQIKTRSTALILLNLSGGDIADQQLELDMEAEELVACSKAVEPKPFTPGTGTLECDLEDEESGASKRHRRNSNLPQEVRLSIR